MMHLVRTVSKCECVRPALHSFYSDRICIFKPLSTPGSLSESLCHTLLHDTCGDFYCIKTTIQDNETRCESHVC